MTSNPQAAQVYSSLSLSGLKIPVKIGWTETERSTDQLIRFDIRFRFPEIPPGCRTDQLKDTICYFELSQKIRQICHQTEYLLIEKLAFQILDSLKKTIPLPVQMQITVTKEQPADMERIEGGASFSIGDWI